MAVSEKNDARTALKNSARLLATIIQGQATVTDAQKIELGLTVRSAPSRIPRPADAPALDIVSVERRTVHLRLHDATDASRRGKPAGVAGATLFSFIGPTPPSNPNDWKFEGNTTRTTFDVTFPDSVAPGTQVWVCASGERPRPRAARPARRKAPHPVRRRLDGGVARKDEGEG